MMVVGVDPVSQMTGYGITDVVSQKPVNIAHGHIRALTGDLSERLDSIHVELKRVVLEWKPEQAAMASAFFGKYLMSAQMPGQVRGAAIIALKCADLSIADYAPRAIRQAVTGNGGDDKQVVHKLVRAMLCLDGDLQSDAADGSAVTLCHAYSFQAMQGASQQPLAEVKELKEEACVERVCRHPC